jgi:hypothetical protein
MTKLKADKLSDIATVEILSQVDGNSWETGKHDVSVAGSRPNIVVRGRTYVMRITTKRGYMDVPYSIGSGLTHENGKVKHPTADDILCSVFQDYYIIESNRTFDDFCNEFGYDTDSRKALDMYLKLQEHYTKFVQTFTHDDIQAIAKVAEEW